MACILIIDDYEPFRRGVRSTLERAGYRVLEAHNGHEGTSQFLDHKPDLVILDIFMPEKDGLETIRDLKRMAPQLPILATSGDSMWAGESLTAAQRFGAACVLEKPIRSEVLLQAVADLL